MKQKLVVIGNGMAGMRTIEELLKVAPEQYDITVFGAEPYGNYNRIMLSPVLSGEMKFDEIITHDLNWYKEHHIQLLAGQDKKVVAVDRGSQQVIAQDGTRVPYDRLLIATGSNPNRLPIPGNTLKGVLAFRDINDVEQMLQAARTRKHAVVIGGGLLGLEAANGLVKQGMNVTVIHHAQRLLNRQLDAPASTLLQQALEARGIRFKMMTQTASLEGDQQDQVQKVHCADGSCLDADLVVMATGVRPNIELARAIGLHCERGIIVSDTMQSFDPKIYAVGECVQHRGEVFGLVAPLWDQAKVCANHLAGMGDLTYRSIVVATKLKVTGINLYSAGIFRTAEHCETVVYQDSAAGIYKKIVIRNQRIVGIVLYGDTDDGNWYFKMMQEAVDITPLQEALIFGPAYLPDTISDSQLEPSAPANYGGPGSAHSSTPKEDAHFTL
ncbi:hypothetical protein OLMES_4121 [Oleiphilus messinensis]|uniref:Uncharacterized protein n=1 Tax=Oleiphilus messinensis TaxID=141451 RepID=A0A1Y0IC77_9GAMM|nr:FAD-dependent oxidoreductase [Oleiphilus messinensis]ARU58138.1 hypothetical protein OLMES_4121 [Oleiphilus messinensis]